MDNNLETAQETRIAKIVETLCQLNVNNPVDSTGDLNELLTRNIAAVDVQSKFQILPEEIPNLVPWLQKYNPDDKSEDWKYICLNFYYLTLLKDILGCKTLAECLSVQQITHLKIVVRNAVGIGIRSNLLPNLPYYLKLPSGKDSVSVSIFLRYRRLVATTYAVCASLTSKLNPLKALVIPGHVTWLLSAFYQILYCPLKKPSQHVDEQGFVMTEEIYNSALSDRKVFKGLFKEFSCAMHVTLYVRETMMLLYNKSLPTWLKRSVSMTLREIIRSPKGVENVAATMLDAVGFDDPNDSTRSWKTIDIIARIVMDARKLTDFRGNICEQLKDLLKLRDRSGEPIKPFERLVALCTKLLFQQDESLCQEVFINYLLKPVICLTDEKSIYNDGNVTESVSQTIRLVRSLVVERNFNIPVLPLRTITPVINVLFCVYSVTFHTSDLQELNSEIKDALVAILEVVDAEQKFEIFDIFFTLDFSKYKFAKTLFDHELTLKRNRLNENRNDYAARLCASNRPEVIKHLLGENLRLKTSCFAYLLNRLINHKEYLKIDMTNQDLPDLQNEVLVLPYDLQRGYVVYKLLSDLGEDKNVQRHMEDNPLDIIKYIQTVLAKAVEINLHNTTDLESDGLRIFIRVLVLLQGLVLSAPEATLVHYRELTENLQLLSSGCCNRELKNLLESILSDLTADVNEKVAAKEGNFETGTKSLLDMALDDTADPLVPVKGHGLMTLAKLIEKKDKSVIERKLYVLTILQQNLNNEDSYIYLNAIGGLAAMGDIFPDTVLSVLAEEYADVSRKDSEDGPELRMKVGEVLVRVIRTLGDSAPKHKALLLNTFLDGAKDEDDLIRASSLSNLGEVCRVLGYKLGSIVTEVLVCVHAIISTDKAVEARRAAVTVIRQLFVGLEKEMIVFLKDEILPVYRTLKHIYKNDADDIMRLQAQLALEQLNENMKDFILSNPKLPGEKKLVMLD